VPKEHLSALVRISHDVIFSRDVLCPPLSEEPFALTGDEVRDKRRVHQNKAPESQENPTADSAEQPTLF